MVELLVTDNCDWQLVTSTFYIVVLVVMVIVVKKAATYWFQSFVFLNPPNFQISQSLKFHHKEHRLTQRYNRKSMSFGLALKGLDLLTQGVSPVFLENRHPKP